MPSIVEEACKVNNTSRYILPHWNLELARSLVNGNGVSVHLKLSYDDYFLSIVKLINNHGLGIGDEIGYIVILICQSQFSNYFQRFIIHELG
ncbi:hypothetical protein H5410_051769, partial [Solanum commersonii]